MKNLFHINSIYHTAAKNNKVLGSSKKGINVNALKQEAIAIIEKLKNEKKPVSSIQADPRFMAIQELLAMDGSDDANDVLDEIWKNFTLYEVGSTSDPLEDWVVAQDLRINTNSDANKLLTRLNYVASQKIPIVIGDYSNFNTGPYADCADSRTRTWASERANEKMKQTEEYRLVLDDLKNQKLWFFAEDFFSANAPIVYTYYAHDPSKLAAINNYMLQNFNLYANRSRSPASGGYDMESLRMSLHNQQNGPLKGVPWHLIVYFENGKEHLFAEKLLADFTERLAQEDPQAMCILMARMRISMYPRLEAHFSARKKSNGEKSGDYEQEAGVNNMAKEKLPGPQAAHKEITDEVFKKGIVVGDNLLSDGPDSISYKFNEVFTKYKNGLQGMIDSTNQQAQPMRYAQFVAHNADFQDAAAQAQKKINTWKYNYKYEKNMRTQNGQYDDRWRASNVDIIFYRAFTSGYIDGENRLRFIFSGKNKIVNIKIYLKPSDKIVKHDSNGRVIRNTKPRTWTVDSIAVNFSWASLNKNGLTGNTATGFLIRDASKGDNQISVNNASVFKTNDQVFIASSQSVGSGNVDEAVYEADLFVSKIIDNQNILLKSPLRFNWDMTRNPFVRLKSDKSEKIPEYISEIGDDCLEDGMTVNKNLENTANFPSGPFSNLSSSYLEGKDREDISLAASIVREEIAANFHLLKQLSAGFKGTKGASDGMNKLQKNNPAEYASYVSLVNAMIDYLKRKLVWFQDKSGLTDEAIECYVSIGNPSLQASIKKLNDAIADPSNADDKNRLEFSLKQLTMAKDLFDVVLTGAESSLFKGKPVAMDIIKWFETSVRALIDNETLGKKIQTLIYQNRELYEMIQMQSAKIMRKELEAIDDFHVLDFAATIMHGSNASAEKNACRVEKQRLMEDMHKYVASNPDIAFVQSQMFSVCKPDENKQADCEDCYKKTSSLSSGIYESIDQWLRHIARKAYLE